ncbi:YmdB family metallophosphoesterase [Streptomyces sp. 7N604]|uniref:YmdB family metallophosphoesterase n=1 Tax=Streptomyces sp. 7N604 TaxID=3457415 RepID=UPI003FD28EB4
MIVIFIGDIVGAEAARYLADRVPQLRAGHGAHAVIANAENCAPNGLGMARAQIDMLLQAGVDVITGGNHSWDSAESVELLDHPRVVRPMNVAEGVPGRGQILLETAAGPLNVINLADGVALRHVKALDGKVLPAYLSWSQAGKEGTVLVDYHGDLVIEKQIFAYAADGQAAAVLGTHTHEPTLPMHLLPGGTALVCDVGMTGPLGGVQGFDPGPLVANLKQRGNAFAGPLPRPLRGAPVLGAVLLEVEDGKAVRLERLP